MANELLRLSTDCQSLIFDIYPWNYETRQILLNAVAKAPFRGTPLAPAGFACSKWMWTHGFLPHPSIICHLMNCKWYAFSSTCLPLNTAVCSSNTSHLPIIHAACDNSWTCFKSRVDLKDCVCSSWWWFYLRILHHNTNFLLILAKGCSGPKHKVYKRATLDWVLVRSSELNIYSWQGIETMKSIKVTMLFNLIGGEFLKAWV